MDFAQAKEFFINTTRKISHLTAAVTMLHWDMETIMPKKAGPTRAQVLGSVSTEIFLRSTSKEMGQALALLREKPEALSKVEARMVEEAVREYDRFVKIPPEVYEAYSVATAEASQVWKEAKDANSFALFQPYLQKIIDFSRQFTQYWGYEGSAYDALLEEYDPEMKAAQIDPIFEKLLAGTRALMGQVKAHTELPAVKVEPARQQMVGEYLLRVMGYDLDAGNLYTTEHPFTTSIHSGDIRVTTKYHLSDPLSSIFSVLHEGGHGMYDQNVDPALEGTNLFGGTSMSIHESQSRFWENIVGRSREFWQTHLDPVCALCGVSLAPDADTFYRGINRMEPSLVRIEADELTYNLHIIIRYEIEKMIFDQNVNAADLPEIWRAKYKEYLGLVPPTDTLGVLQDSHWSSGSFGYFPSYALGNLCAAQFLNTFEAAHGPLGKLVQTGEGLAQIGGWLKKEIHHVGCMEKPAQILQRVTGENVNPDYFLRYMEAKVKDVYGG